MKLFSPAKLNLFFRVLNQREDGLHEIATLMQAISLGDILFFRKSDSHRFSCSHPNIPTDETNGVRRADALFRKKTGYARPLAIHLEKNIPVEGGFGGGSSNIATTLWALNQLSERNIHESILSSWAAELSSDAPFFFSNGAAYATGRGEIIAPLPSFKKETFFLAKPKKGLSTPLVYRQHRLHFSLEDPKILLKKALSGSIRGVNDLEESAFFLYPGLKILKEKLIHLGFTTVSMTGSGSGFYCLGDVKNPTLPEVQFWKTTSLFREKKWYSIPTDSVTVD